MVQVFLNVLLNAAEAAPEKGHVVLRWRSEREWAVVEVEDDGPGLPDTVAARLFEPFFTTRTEGLGLGLAVSREIVRRHRGELTYDGRTASGTGSKFTVKLPLAVQAPSDEASSILVVEDDQSLLKALVRLLKRSGYEATSAITASDALNILAMRKIDAVLTDFRMPGGTGVELVREMRKRKLTAPAILVTANFDCHEVQDALAENLFAASVTKPWNQEDLLALLAKTLASKA
ncbi:MAG: hybrid sensor histidine kinase/response regulator [Myxococcales bacterium]